MARLPQPGGDTNSWGVVLNDFLSVSHNADGTLKSSALAGQVFSRGATLIDPVVSNVVVWRAPFACTVMGVSAYRVGGTGATINARKNGSDTFLTVDLSVSTPGSWSSGGALQNTAVAAGDSIEVMITGLSGTPTQIAIQIDLQTT